MDLTKTEFDVCAHTSAGFEAKEIARKTFRSVFTIRTQQQKIRIKNKFRNNYEMSMHFILEYGDPRKYIATLLLLVQLGIIYTDCSDDLKRVRKTKISRSKKGSKTRELYV